MPLFEAALRIAVPKIGTFMVEHMSQLMQGVAFSTFRSPTVPKLAAAICEQVRKLVEVGDEQTVVVAVHSMASAGFAVPGPVASQMAHGLMSKRPDARHLTQMAWALVTSADVGGVGSPLGGLLDLLSVAALRQAPEFKNKDRALFGWTLWKGHCEHGHGFTPLAIPCCSPAGVNALRGRPMSHFGLVKIEVVRGHDTLCPAITICWSRTKPTAGGRHDSMRM